jgi:antitoxin (DNA-binding transcriptional repressor) of toxin-antitoxin stability system
MEIVTVSELQRGSDKLEKSAEEGSLAVLTKNGKPICVFVPFDEALMGKALEKELKGILELS